MEVREIARAVARRWRAIVAIVGVCLLAGIALTMTAQPQYASTTRLFVAVRVDDAAEAYQGSLFAADRAQSYANLATNRQQSAAVIDQLGLHLTPTQLRRKVSASVVPNTVMLQIKAEDADPKVAQKIAAAEAQTLIQTIAQVEVPSTGKTLPIKVSVVEDADLPSSPSTPNWPTNLLLATALGLLLATAAVVLREFTDNRVKSGDDLARATPLPLLSSVPFVRARSGRAIDRIQQSGPYGESIRVLRTNLQFVDLDNDRKILQVTSAVPQEGKTATVAGVAIAMAAAGSAVAVVDCDLRRPSLHETLGLDGTVGLTTILIGAVSVDEAIQVHAETGLNVITSGRIPPNPSEILQSRAMDELIKELRDRFDVVLIDAPPLLPVTDAAVIATRVDGTLMVVRAGSTTLPQVRQALARLQAVRARVAGVVLNMTKDRRHGYGDDEYAAAAVSSTDGRG